MTDSRIRLLLLDFDGTLADTRRANTLAYVETLREAGYALTEEEYAARYFGMRCEEFLTRIGVADPAERERLRLRKIALYPRYFDTVRLNRPLWEFCRQFRAQGGRVWIVSTGSRANIGNVMRHLGIGGPAAGPDEAPLGRVDGVLSGADVARSKPHPDCFLEAMRREGCSPRETLIFEDSAIGRPPQRSGLCRRQTLNSSQMPDDPAGIADSHDTGRNRMRNDAACTDRRAIPDGHARKDHTPSADPHVVADDYGSRR